MSSSTCVKMKLDNRDNCESFVLQEVENCLCVVFIIDDQLFDQTYLIEGNLLKFKEGLNKLLGDTTKSLS